MARLVAAALCALVGVLSLILVISALSVAGTDDVTETTPHRVADGTYAFVLDEQIVPFTNTTATIRASSDKQLMMASGNGVDTDSYLTGVQHEQISDVKFPGELVTRVVAGQPQPEAPADTRDWWVDRKIGQNVSTSFDVDGTPQTVVITPTGTDTNLDGTTVVVAMQVRGVLAFCLMGVALSILMFALAFATYVWWRNDQPRPGKRAGKRAGRRAGKRTGGVLAVSALVLSGCGLPVAKPETPEIVQYSRPGIRRGEAAEYMQNYSDRLGAALAGDPKELDAIQTGPLLDRTRAEMAIAEASDTDLKAPRFDQVLAGSNRFTSYPMWFMAFGHVDKKDAGTQAMLVRRENASSEWIAVQSLFVPENQVPGFEVDEEGSVQQAPADFSSTIDSVSQGLAEYLSDGDQKHLTDAGGKAQGDAFKEFRAYVGSYKTGENAFDTVESECRVYDAVDLKQYTLKTLDGAVGFGEVRCTLTLEVPAEFAVTLPKAVQAVNTSDERGNRVIIDASVPILVRQSGETVNVIGSDWFLLESRMEEN